MVNNPQNLIDNILVWSQQLGFDDFSIASIDLSTAEARLLDWLDRGFHGEMHFMEKHGSVRSHPEQLVDDTACVLSFRMNYLPEAMPVAIERIDQSGIGNVSVYAHGKDYHKLIRKRLQQLCQKIEHDIGPFGYRVFTDSAPVLEKPLAENGGLGWIGKHSNLINKKEGSWFFLGEIYLDFKLPTTAAHANHCGRCTTCIDVCPTQAIVEPYVVDARKCISYLTIEYDGIIPEQYRKAIGNRIYGCDDCQLFCPWNKFAKITEAPAFHSQYGVSKAPLEELILWTEDEFLQRLAGSPIRRIGHQRWIRNLAVALGNAQNSQKRISALKHVLIDATELTRPHIEWALNELDKLE